MPKRSKEFDRSTNDGARRSREEDGGHPVAPDAAPPPILEARTVDPTEAPVEADLVAGTDEEPPRAVDYVALAPEPSYLNAAYTRPEQIDPYPYRDLSLFDGLPVSHRQLVADRALRIWARALRRFARAAVWALPLGAIGVALGAAGGWPTPAAPTSGNPGTWLILTIAGLTLVVIGVVGLASLMAPTAGGPWAAGAVVAMVAGSLLLAPVLGLVALVRPAGPRLADGAAAHLEAQVMQAASARWLGVSGLALIAVAGLALGCGILATRVLNRGDGWLVLIAVALAVVSAYAGWQFLLVLSGMALLAAALGLAWTASRLTPDGAVNDS
jgi:hypothetical protein